MIDAITVPNRFEDSIGEAKCGDALHRVFSEKMVDPKDLVLVQDLKNAGVESARGIEAVAERLLNHHAPPEPIIVRPVFTLERELCLAELLYDQTEELVANGEIKNDVALCAISPLDIRKNVAEPLVKIGRCHVALDVEHFLRKALPHRLVDLVDRELGGRIADETLQHAIELAAPSLCRSGRAGDA